MMEVVFLTNKVDNFYFLSLNEKCTVILHEGTLAQIYIPSSLNAKRGAVLQLNWLVLDDCEAASHNTLLLIK